MALQAGLLGLGKVRATCGVGEVPHGADPTEREASADNQIWSAASAVGLKTGEPRTVNVELIKARGIQLYN